ncbi:NagB/RpiA/CoA transferase-like superfamily protein [Zea mays]|uniref:NagB/RpiA/CoA transferase-like superfamily protein n=1 Tax=Zea mays TaxID=4577 RepID=A0A1D6KX22_MAIZE|nr:NagB/RpiA/CoA transferase-like superfamily protein [Zea mays]
MIPPPRHVDNLAPGPPSPAVLATSAPVLSSPRLNVASEIGDNDSWPRVPSAVELDKSGKSAGAAISKQAKPVKTVQKKDVPQAASTVVSEKKATERPPERERKLDAPHPRMQFDDVHKVEKAKKRAVVNQSEARNRVELFRHLPQ